MLKKFLNEVAYVFREFKYLKSLKKIKQPKKTTPFIQIEFKIPEPTEDEIRVLAHQKWEQAQPSNRSCTDFWEEAENELKGKKHENIHTKSYGE